MSMDGSARRGGLIMYAHLKNAPGGKRVGNKTRGGSGFKFQAERCASLSAGYKALWSGWRQNANMDSARCGWIVLILLSGVTWGCGVSGRAVKTPGFPSQAADEASGLTLRADALKRWRRADAAAHRERCAELAAPWQENALPVPRDNATLLELRVRPFHTGASRDPVFPGKTLFSFVRRVYRCCREGALCRSVKGIPGRLRGGTDVEFLLSREVFSLRVTRAELHLHLSNPHHLDVHPVLSALSKRGLPTRYTRGSRGDAVELQVDLLLLLQRLQEAAGGAGAGGGPSVADARQVFPSSVPRDPDGAPWGPVLELGLVLGCSRAGWGVPCGTGGVRLSHPPFMALYYQ
ncbi:uncharacterized protein si:ch211-170d8.2 [Antennarius striatus]|uniref:uncharacterized protein si:ch211-170d8.2 n=1 Tax=Antennarius striatus TaxID=241820 RepID=UPI0035AE310D